MYSFERIELWHSVMGGGGGGVDITLHSNLLSIQLKIKYTLIVFT